MCEALSPSLSFVVCLYAWPAKEIHLTFGYNSWLPSHLLLLLLLLFLYIFWLMLLRLARGINKLGARATAAVVAAVRSSLLDCVLAMANKQRYAHQARSECVLLLLIYGNLP